MNVQLTIVINRICLCNDRLVTEGRSHGQTLREKNSNQVSRSAIKHVTVSLSLMKSWTIFWSVAELCNYIIMVVYIFGSIYMNIKACSRNNEMFMQKRSIIVFYSLNFSLILYIVSLLFFEMAFDHFKSKILVSISIILVYIALWSLSFTVITKNWMIYYKYKWTYYTLQYQWQQHINSAITKEQNWFIAHNKTYGNLHYFSKMYGLFCISSFILTLIPALITVIKHFNTIALIIATILILSTLGPLILIYIIIVRKTPSFYDDDEFKIHWESKIHSKLLALFIIILTIFDTFLIVFGIKGIKKVSIIGLPFVSLPFIIMIYISTVVVSRKNEIKYLSLTDRISEGHDVKTNSISLDMIFVNEAAFHLFMTYLSKEYSMEVLLSIIEFQQFQDYLISMSDSDNVDILQSLKQIKFYSNMVQSEIIQTTKRSLDGLSNSDSDQKVQIQINTHSAKINAHKLYIKYIKWGSEFEINIGSIPRLQLKNQLDSLDILLETDLSINDLILLFEDAKSDQLKLLRHSLNRFRYLDEFDKVLSLFQDEIK